MKNKKHFLLHIVSLSAIAFLVMLLLAPKTMNASVDWVERTKDLCPEWKKVQTTLLSIGGDGVILGYSPFWNKIMEEGKQYDYPIQYVDGHPFDCHNNVCVYFNTYNTTRIATGYCLWTNMNEWISHSWIMDGNTIVECSTKPGNITAYWGTTLSQQESIDWSIYHYYYKSWMQT